MWALIWVAGAHVGLWCCGMARVRSLLLAAASRSPRIAVRTPGARDTLGAAVEATGRAIPKASCLVRALGAEALFRQAGVPCEVHLGAKGIGAAFGAHAWVESGGRSVVGDGPSGTHRLGHLPIPPGAVRS